MFYLNLNLICIILVIVGFDFGGIMLSSAELEEYFSESRGNWIISNIFIFISM